jgi:hypothetical protein
MRLIADIYDRPSVDFRNKADLAALASGRFAPTGDIDGYATESAQATFIGHRQSFSQEAPLARSWPPEAARH